MCLCVFFVFCAVFSYLLVMFFFIRVPEKEFIKAYKSHPRLKTKVNNFNRQPNSNTEEDFVAIRPEWTTVDRILACRYDSLKLLYIHMHGHAKFVFLLFLFDLSLYEPKF